VLDLRIPSWVFPRITIYQQIGIYLKGTLSLQKNHKNMTRIAFFLCTLFCFSGFVQPHQTEGGTLKIVITSVKNATGEVCVALYNSEASFMKEEQMYAWECVPAKKGSVTVSFSDLPEGTYAFSILHDENKNKTIDLGFMGIPKEGYGFSNNSMGFMAPPSFDKAKFSFSGKGLTQSVKMK